MVSMLSLGPIAEGYSLVLPREHIACVAEMPEALKGAFSSQVLQVGQKLETCYGKLIAFEHGRSTCASPSPVTHCHHAHLHIVPTAVDLAAILEREVETETFWLGNCNCATTIVQALEAFWGSVDASARPYLLAMSHSGASVHFIEQPLRPQYLRYLLAREIGNEDLANWIANPGYDLIDAAKTRIGSPIHE